jgi:hypothetical protein
MSRQLTIVFLFITHLIVAQSQESFKANYQGTALTQVFQEIEDHFDIGLYYDRADLEGLTFTGQVDEKDEKVLLNQVIKGFDFFLSSNGNNFFITKVNILTDELPLLKSWTSGNTEKMEESAEESADVIFRKSFATQNENLSNASEEVIELGLQSKYAKNKTSLITGRVTRAEDGAPLEGALIFSGDGAVSTLTDERGYFSIKLLNGRQDLTFQYVGMERTTRKLMVFSEGSLNVTLQEDAIALKEVVVEASAERAVESLSLGLESIDIEDFKELPAVLGERDVLKVATLLPGINSQGEGAAGFYVRGGKSDQNLFLFDGATVYNVSHFLGFFSVFNADALGGMDIYKGGIPAKYGGRLSSVFDISSKMPSKEKFTLEGGISTIATRLTAEVPLFNGRSSLMVSGRTTYSDWVTRLVDNPEFSDNQVDFSDLVVKYHQSIDASNNIGVSAYTSTDNFSVRSDTLFTFSDFSNTNRIITGFWQHRFNGNFDGKLTISRSDYGYEISADQVPERGFLQDFGIAELTGRADFNLDYSDRHAFNFGTEVKRYDINPGSLVPLGEGSERNPNILNPEQGIEAAVYFSDEFRVSDRLSINAGARLSIFQQLGAGEVYLYQEGAPPSESTRIDSISYADGEVMQTYGGPEFRLSGRYLLGEQSSLKVGYGRNRQYVHSLMNTASVSPTDIWRLSNRYIKPQIADELSIGFFQNFSDIGLNASVEVYGKLMQNLIDFRTGATFLLNSTVETAVLQGDGRAYGVELSLEKQGRLNGWLNYTYSRSFIKLDGATQEGRINGGEFFPTNFDMPHVLNLVSNYDVTKRFVLSMNFVYNSGRPLTVPTGVYDIRGIDVINFSERNSDRMRDYIRMDIGFTLKYGHRQNKFAKSFWSLSLYNVLGRDNPFSVFFDVDREQGNVRAYELVIFGNMIPTISYNFKL